MNDPHLIASEMACPYCGGRVNYASNGIIYGRPFGDGFVYVCANFPECDSYVGAHGDKADKSQRYKPFGTLANKPLREIRRSVHAMIDPYHRLKIMKRREIYRVIAGLLKLPASKTHVGMLDVDQCKKVLSGFHDALPPHLQNYFLDVPKILPKE